MLVTVNTDASFHPDSKHGAYAFWIVCDEFRLKRSDVFKTKCRNPDDAEARCIINALSALKNRPDIRIIVNTDSLNAIALLTNNKKHIRRYMGNRKWTHITKAFKKLNLSNIEFRHVKAHSGKGDKRSYVNEWCDRKAKSELRKIMKL